MLRDLMLVAALAGLSTWASAEGQFWEPACTGKRACPTAQTLRLGASIFVSKAISPIGRACSSCHEPMYGYGATPQTRDQFKHLPRSIPSLLNLSFQRWFFWDGRADQLWQQGVGPLESVAEMDSHRLFLVTAVARDPALAEQAIETGSISADQLQLAGSRLPASTMVACRDTSTCTALWQKLPPATRTLVNDVARNLLVALAEFQLTLKSRRTAYDEYLATGQGLTDQQLRGKKLFFGQARCATCHTGPALTDASFHNLLLPAPSGRQREDPGRFQGIEHLRELAKVQDMDYRPTALSAYLDLNNSVWGQFKTPSIRSIEGRSEFMHNGIYKTLREVLRHYNTLADAQVVHHHPNALLSPLNFKEEQLDDLEAFLNVFTNRRE